MPEATAVHVPHAPDPARLDHLAEEVLKAHGTAALARSPLGDAENVTYRVDTAAGPRLLRLKPPGRLTRSHVASELNWLQALRRDTTLRVPKPIPFPNGELVRHFAVPGAPGLWLGTVLEWVDGEFRPDRLTESDTLQVGRLAASLHAHAETYRLPAGFTRPRLQDDPAFQSWAPLLASRPDLTGPERAAINAALRVAEGALAAASQGAVRTHLLHGDLHQGNYLFAEAAAGAIDFDDCLFGPALYDLAATLAHLSLPDQDGSLAAAFLAGYEDVRPLRSRERELLGAFVTLRHLWMLHWILQRDRQPAFAQWAPEYRAWQLGALMQAALTPRGFY
ncbi:phosphotransferase enzyme family protein [Deinococcus navajonensis]|uniref:Phosphotransferase enzyme family protein n=1 Tax=Deinococcus navajonensis TaxID=309884 RepID=A0ABV8XQE3_9DEIO